MSRAEAASLAQFCGSVLPILESRCALACHGVAVDRYASFMEDPVNSKALYFPIDPVTGRIPATSRWQLAAFQATRGAGNGEDHSRIAYGEEAEFSPLLRYPLAEDCGGLPHRGLDVFTDTLDADYLALRNWVMQEIQLRPAEPSVMTPETTFFRDNVLGVMTRNGCFLGSCHGPDVFNDLKLVAPLPETHGRTEPGQRYSAAMIRANRTAMLGAKTRFANLGGDLRRSRLLVKNLPIQHGGVHQRGGNDQFFSSYDDPDVKVLLEWLSLEKAALARRLTSAGEPIAEAQLGSMQGLAFLRGPRHQPRRFFDADSFWPGSDIWLLPLAAGETLATATAAPVNFTARFHPEGPVEIQSYDLRYDARSLVFSMRRSAERGFRLFELSIDDELGYVEGSFRQLSYAPARLDDGTIVHHIDPLYTPGPGDEDGTALDNVAVVFASNSAGQVAAADTWGLLGEADGGERDTLIDLQRSEAPGTFAGRRLFFVDGPHRGEWRRILRHLAVDGPGSGSRLILDRPLSQEPDRRSVYVIENTGAAYDSTYDLWRLVAPDGIAEVDAFARSAKRMTFTTAHERRPSMRTTGEVMFTSVRNVGFQADRPVFNGAIYRVMAGGFDYHIHGGNRSRYPILTDSRELPSGLEVRLALDPRNLWSGGILLLADHGFGVNIEPDNPVDDVVLPAVQGEVVAAGVRYLPAQHTLFPEQGDQAVVVTGVSPGGSYRDPFPLPDGTILVARAGAVDHLDPNADPDWDLCLLQFSESLQSADGQHAGPVKRVPIAACSSESNAEYMPRPIMVRLKEKVHTHQKFSVSRGKAVPRDIDGVLRMPAGTPAELECYDYPLLQSFLTHFAPVGARDFRSRVGFSAEQGGDADHDLRSVRIVRQIAPSRADLRPLQQSGSDPDPFATPISLGIHTRKRIVAEIPLELDGSFYAEVPTEVPLLVQGLNRHGMALHSMNRWFYLQPGEKLTFSIPRSIFPLRCAGCHGALNGDRSDAMGPPDLVSAASRVMATWSQARRERREPHGGAHRDADEIAVDFRRDVQPILDRHCVACHGETGKPAAGLDLRGIPTRNFSRAYESLHVLEEAGSGNHARKRYINEREGLAVESFLLEKLMGRELDAERQLEVTGSRHPEKHPLSQAEILTLVRWIDLGATFLGGGTSKGDGSSAATKETDR